MKLYKNVIAVIFTIIIISIFPSSILAKHENVNMPEIFLSEFRDHDKMIEFRNAIEEFKESVKVYDGTKSIEEWKGFREAKDRKLFIILMSMWICFVGFILVILPYSVYRYRRHKEEIE